jgi:hypothetical protein
MTGAVGVYGIGGTILATKMTSKADRAALVFSISEENKRNQRWALW